MDRPQAEGTQPAAADGAGQQVFLVCKVCKMPTEPGLRYCSTCRVPLNSTNVVSVDQAAVLVKKRARSRKLRRWQVPVVIAAVVVIAASVIYVRTRPPEPLPAAASDVSASSPPGQFTEVGHDTRQTNFVPDAPTFTGDILWTFQAAEPFSGSVVATDDLVYAGTGDHRVVALDAHTGALRWEYTTKGPVDSSPAVTGDWLFIGMRDGRLVSLDRHTGAERWEFNTGGPVGSPPLVTDGEVYIANSNGRLTVLDAETGAFRWHTENGRALGRVSREGDVVFTAAMGNYYLWDARTGAFLHNYPTSSSVSTAVVIDDGKAYAGDFRGSLWVSDISYRPAWYLKGSGRRLFSQLYLWDLAPKPDNGDLWGKRLGRATLFPFALGGGRIFVPDGDSNVRAVDINTHDVLWTTDVGEGQATGALLAGDTVLVSSASGLHALDADTGDVRWTAVESGVPGSPAVTPDAIYVAGADGVLYALK